jgi:hypothetical protein
METGEPLETVLHGPILRGLLTGLNQAFYIQTSLRDALVRADPSSEPLFKRFLRGRDVKRWVPVWDNQWHIVIPSSHNRTWPWSNSVDETTAEAVFSTTYTYVHRHLKKFEKALRMRQDKGKFWWELRSCDYYNSFETPKIVVQCIAYYSRFSLENQSYYANNKVIIIPTGDLYVLSILNSRITWWIINRTFQHMKDEGLSIDVQFLKRLPVPTPSDELRSKISSLATVLVANAGSNKISTVELELNELVEQAFAITDTQRGAILSSLPPRDPIAEIECAADKMRSVAAAQ